MTVVYNELSARLNSILAVDTVLTPSQLKLEALTVKQCQATATGNSIIGLTQQLLALLAGDIRHAPGLHMERYRAWISGSDQDRKEFISIVESIAVDFYKGYSLAGVPIDDSTIRTQTFYFTFLAYFKSLGMYARYVFLKAVIEAFVPGIHDGHPFYHDLDLFLWTLEVCAFKTMEMIESVISLEVMQESVQSQDRKDSLLLSAGCYYAYKLQDTGEVGMFLITADCNFALGWINLWKKVDRTSNMDYLHFKATNLRCICRKTIEPGSACVILDNCYDLLCDECARVAMDSIDGRRRCPFCFAATQNWMTNTVFERLKTRMKKRKEDASLWRLATVNTDIRKIPEAVRRVSKSIVRADLLQRKKGGEDK